MKNNTKILSIIGVFGVTGGCQLGEIDTEWSVCRGVSEGNGILVGYFKTDYYNPIEAQQDIERYNEGYCRSSDFKGCFAVPEKSNYYACSPCSADWRLQCEAGGECVDVRTNNDHCGACGNVCGKNQKCSEGKCVSEDNNPVSGECSADKCKDAKTLLRCEDNGSLKEVECAKGCANDACISDETSSKCEFNQCKDDKTLLRCEDDGSLKEVECEKGCAEDACISDETPSKCDSNQCKDDKVLLQCDDGVTKFVECSYKCENNACVGAVACDANKEIWDETANTCVCNGEKNWTGEAGNCVCKEGYYLDETMNCVSKSCSVVGQIFDESLQKCVCNEAAHWIEFQNGCGCDGFVFQDGCYMKGDYIEFGHYEQDNHTGNGDEPISWLILNVSSDASKALLISRYVLFEAKYYNGSNATWGASSLRSLLNGDSFLKKAFTTEEQSNILLTSVDSTKSGCGKKISEDSIFILSVNELKKHLPSKEGRAAVQSEWLAATTTSKYNYYWTRTPLYMSNDVCTQAGVINIVKGDGTISPDTQSYNGKNGYMVKNVYGVRPALWLKLK